MADGGGVDEPTSICQAGPDEEDEEDKGLTSLMEHLRNKEKSQTSRSWQDTCKLWKHSVTDKRQVGDPDDRNLIQDQLESLSKAVRVGSVSSLVEHLDQCGRKSGLTLVTTTGANKVILKGDMYEVHVIMDNQAKVKDVIISHGAMSHHRDPQSPEESGRAELTQLISTNQFAEFSRHLDGLSAMFSIPGDRAQRTKAFIALQSLETDLNMLYKMQSTISSVANYIHKSPLGILQPRIGGLPMQMTYFVGPYDLLCPKTHSFCPMTVEAVIAQKVGYRVNVGIKPSVSHVLQTMPLIMDGKSTPSFSPLNKINSCQLPAVFVLQLHEQLPLALSLIQKIVGVTGVEFVDRRHLKSLMSLIIQHVRKKDIPDTGGAERGLHVHLPDQRHSYFLHPWPGGLDPEGAMVTEIPFTHPTHVATILNFLRQQVLFNTLVASCVRNSSPHMGHECWTFELVPGTLSMLTISFEHPFSDTIATVEIDLSDVTAVKCHIVVDKETPDPDSEGTFCTDDAATKVLQRCLSLPVTLRWILQQALTQLQLKLTMPSQQVDSATSPTHPSITSGFGLYDASSAISKIGFERRQAFIDAHARSQLPWKHMNNYIGMYNTMSEILRTNIIAPPPVPMETIMEPMIEETFDSFGNLNPDMENSDKVSKNPMLASLLGQDVKSPHGFNAGGVTGDVSPSTSSTSSSINQSGHSMLSALLGDSSSPQQNTNIQQSPLHGFSAGLQPLSDKQKKRGKRKSMGERNDMNVRGHKRKPSEEEMRRDMTMYNVDGSSSSPIDVKNKPMKLGPLGLAGQGGSTKVGMGGANVTGHANLSTAVHESHVNRLASTMDNFIKQDNLFPSPSTTPTLAPPMSIPVSLSTHSSTDHSMDKAKRFKSESESSVSLSKSPSPNIHNAKLVRSMSDSDSAFTRLTNRNSVKIEKPDPFDFAFSVPGGKDKMDINPRAIKQESLNTMREKSPDFLRTVIPKKSESLDNPVRWKEKRKEKKEIREAMLAESKNEIKDKPPAITVKLNTRDLTARTIIKESPRHNSSPAESEVSGKREFTIRVKTPTPSSTIDLTMDENSNASNHSQQGRSTPYSTPANSPRILPTSLKREILEKNRGEKKRKNKYSSEDSDKKYKKHNDDTRKEQLSKKQRIYDFEADVNESDYRVEKVPSKKTTIKIRSGKVTGSGAIGLSTKIAAIAQGGLKSRSLGSPSLKIVKSGENRTLVSNLSSKQKYSRSKSETQLQNSNPSGNGKEMDTKLCRTPTIKLKPLNLPNNASVSVSPTVSNPGQKVTQASTCSPLTVTVSKPSQIVSSTSNSAINSTNSAHKVAKSAQNKPQKLLAVIDKLKKQQVTSPSGAPGQLAVYDAIRLEIIREGNKPSTPTKDILPSTLKSSHIKKIDPSTKPESSKKSDFSKSGAMPVVNNSLGVIPKTITSQASKQNQSGTPTSSSNKVILTTTTGNTQTKPSIDPVPQRKDVNNKMPQLNTSIAKPDVNKVDYQTMPKSIMHKTTQDVLPHVSKVDTEIRPRTEGPISSRDPRTANSKASASPIYNQNCRAPSPMLPAKDKLNIPIRTSTPPLNKPSRLDDLSDKLNKGQRHFLDAVKIPVNGKGKGPTPGNNRGSPAGPALDSKGDPDKHPNHEIFTENPSSPTDEIEPEIEDLRIPAFAQKGSIDGMSPAVDGSRQSPLVERTATPIVDNTRTPPVRSSPLIDGVRSVSPSSSEGSLGVIDLDSNVKANDVPRNRDLGVPKPSGHCNEKWISSDSQEAWKNNASSADTLTAFSNPTSFVNSDSVVLSKDGMIARNASPLVRTPSNSSQDSRISPHGYSPSANSESRHSESNPVRLIRPSLPSCPDSPVSSPEDGLVIDFPSSPKTNLNQSVGSMPNLTKSASPIIQLSTASNNTSPSQNHRRTPIKTPPCNVSNSSSNSPESLHNSPGVIDDDLMDEALML